MEELSSGCVDAVKSPGMTERFSKDGLEPASSTIGRLQKHIALEIGEWRKAITEAGIEVE